MLILVLQGLTTLNTHLIGTKENHIFLGIYRCTNNIVNGRFGVVKPFAAFLRAFLEFSCAKSYG